MFPVQFLRWLYINAVPPRIKRAYKRTQIKLHPRPMMSHQEIQLLDSILTSPFVHCVLEIGSGGSTLYFPTRHPVDWHSVEFNPSWYQDIRELAPGNVQLYLLEDIPAFVAQFSPRAKEFQVVLIDGPEDNRERVIEAIRDWDTDALVLLHDSHRRVYERALSAYFRCVHLSAGEFARPGGGYKARGLSLLMSARPRP